VGSRYDVVALTPLIELRDVSVAFGTTVALSRVSFDLHAGEVHVVAGENGAGKSTLIRVMAGALTSFQGQFSFAGRPAAFRSPADATRAGIATIHQELSLVPSLSVEDNLALGAGGRSFALFDRTATRDRARRALERVALAVDPETPVEELPLAERQLVEIARALARDARVLVMDEPTSALSEPEAARLLAIVRDLVRAGTGVVYISHRLNEIEALADRISVLRDGVLVLVASRRDLSREALLAALLGERSERRTPRERAPDAAARLTVENLSGPHGSFRNLSLAIGIGEIVGLAGAEGSGASHVLRALAGDLPAESGTVVLDGAPYTPKTPREAFARGVAYLASDRQSSVLANLSVRDNGMLSKAGGGALSLSDGVAERRALEPEATRLRLKAPSLEVLAGSLSGGNQQKVALLRCLAATPRLLLLDDPARGIDLGAKADLFSRLHDVAAASTSVLFYSSDLSELVEHADRVLVLYRGALVATFVRGELDLERLLAPVMGATA